MGARLQGCRQGCKKNFWYIFIFFIFVIVGSISPLIELTKIKDLNWSQINETDILIAPITEDDSTSLNTKLSQAGLNDFATNINSETYENNTTIITQDLCLNDKEVGVLLNKVFFNQTGLSLREFIITKEEKLHINMTLKIDVYEVLKVEMLKGMFFYTNIEFDLELIDNVYTNSNIIITSHGLNQKYVQVTEPDKQIDIIMLLLNGSEELRSLPNTFGASSMVIEAGQITLLHDTSSTPI